MATIFCELSDHPSYLQPYLQELYNLTLYLTLCTMETLNLSFVYVDSDGYDECMRAGSLKTSLPARLYIFIFNVFLTNP